MAQQPKTKSPAPRSVMKDSLNLRNKEEMFFQRYVHKVAKFWTDPNSPLHCAGKSLIAFEPDCTAVKKEVAERKVCIDKTSNAKTRKKYCVYPIQGTTHCGVFAQPCPENPRICSFWDLCTRTLDNLICSPDVGLRNLINTQSHSFKGFLRKRSPICCV